MCVTYTKIVEDVLISWCNFESNRNVRENVYRVKTLNLTQVHEAQWAFIPESVNVHDEENGRNQREG